MTCRKSKKSQKSKNGAKSCLGAVALLTLLATLSACAHKVVSSPLVSMTRTKGATRESLTSVGRVKTEWCRGDPSNTGTEDPALMDEVTLKAQKSKKADYLGDTVYWRKGNCMTVEGVALKAPAGK